MNHCNATDFSKVFSRRKSLLLFLMAAEQQEANRINSHGIQVRFVPGTSQQIWPEDDTFSDAQEQRRLFPSTFLYAPSEAALSTLDVGDLAKLCSDRISERFWVIIMEIQEDNQRVIGRVSNILCTGDRYDYGDLVQFQKRHIYDIIKAGEQAQIIEHEDEDEDEEEESEGDENGNDRSVVDAEVK